MLVFEEVGEEGLVGFLVPVGEAGFPVPPGVGDLVVLGEIADGDGVAKAAGGVGEGDGAEFAKVDGAAEVVGPLAGLGEEGAEVEVGGGVLGGGGCVVAVDEVDDFGVVFEGFGDGEGSGGRAGEGDVAEVLEVDPFGSLVGEVEGFVAVEGDDEAGVVIGEVEAVELGDVAEFSGAEDEDAGGIDAADGADGFCVEWVDGFGGEGVAGFVEEFEEEGVRPVFEVAGDGFPAGDEGGFVGGGVFGEVVEVVPVEEDAEVFLEGVFEDGFEVAEEIGGDVGFALGVGFEVEVPGDGDADVVEALCGDGIDVFVGVADAP